MALTIADLLKSRESIPQNQRSETAPAIKELTEMMKDTLGSNPNVLQTAKTTTSRGVVKDVSKEMLVEQKKTNSLLGDMMKGQAKYFEDNKELIERLMTSQEQQRERKTNTVDAIAKSASESDVTKNKEKKKDDSGIGLLALGPLAVILGTALPGIIKFMNEKFPKSIEAIEEYTKMFTAQNAETRDAIVAGTYASKAVLSALANKVDPSAAAKKIASDVAMDAESAAVKAAAAQKVAAAPKISAVATASDAAMDAEARAMSTARQNISGVRVAPQAPSSIGAAADIEAAKPPAPEPKPEPKNRFRPLKAAASAVKQGASAGASAAGSIATAAAEGAAKIVGSDTVKTVAKTIASKAMKAAAASVPFLGSILQAFDAAKRFEEKDFLGAIYSSAGAGLALVPAVGTAVNLPLMAAQLTRDVYNDVYKSGVGGAYENVLEKDLVNNPELAKERLLGLGPVVYEALQEAVSEAKKAKEKSVKESGIISTNLQGQNPELFRQLLTGEIENMPDVDYATADKKTQQALRYKELAKAHPGLAEDALATQGYTPEEISNFKKSAPGTVIPLLNPSEKRAQPVQAAPRSQEVPAANQGAPNVIVVPPPPQAPAQKNSGGGGGASGMPNSSTAPSSPWDVPLYGLYAFGA